MSTLSREDTARISAAIFAYLAKPAPAPAGISKADVEGILAEFGRELREGIMKELAVRVEGLERKLDLLDRHIRVLSSKVEGLSKGVIIEKPYGEVSARKLSWGLAGRHDAGAHRDVVRHLPKSSSFWSLASKFEKLMYHKGSV